MQASIKRAVRVRTVSQAHIVVLVPLRVPAVLPILSLIRVPAHAAIARKVLHRLLGQLNALKTALLVVSSTTAFAYPASRVLSAPIPALQPVANVPKIHIPTLERSLAQDVNQGTDVDE